VRNGLRNMWIEAAGSQFEVLCCNSSGRTEEAQKVR
jgi:hypothetical protein